MDLVSNQLLQKIISDFTPRMGSMLSFYSPLQTWAAVSETESSRRRMRRPPPLGRGIAIKLLSKQWIFIYKWLHDDVVPTEHSYHCSNSLAVGPEKLNLQYPFVKKIQSMGKTAQS